MNIPLKAGSVATFVICTALVGMVLGGGFGYVAGRIAPDFFVHFVSWADFKGPFGIAIMLGAFGGVVCGGFLGAFAVAVQIIGLWLSGRQTR